MQDPITPTEDGHTLLHHLFANYSSSKDADKLFILLMDSKKFSNPRTDHLTQFEETALDLAVMHKTEAVKLAIEYKYLFDFNLRNNSKGLTLLHRAVECNNFSALIDLLEKGLCNPRARDIQGSLAVDKSG